MALDVRDLEEHLGEPIIHIGQKHGFPYILTASTSWLAKPIRDLERMLWWQQTDELLRQREFHAMPAFFIWQGKWVVMQYIPGRTARYRNMSDLQRAVRLLARFHVAAHQAQQPSPLRSGIRLPERLTNRYEQYRQLHSQLANFPHLFPASKQFALLGGKALERLRHTPLADLTNIDQEQGAVSHRDLASHNILIDESETAWLIDFDTANVDLRLGDLWQMCSRALVEWHWNPHIYDTILQTYETVRPLNALERSTLAHLFLYPNDFYREALGLLKRRSGFSHHKVIPYLQMMCRDCEKWYAFLRYIGVAW